MINIEFLEESFIRMDINELRTYLFNNNLIKREMKCLGSCKTSLTYETCKNHVDDAAWRCYQKTCTFYQKRRSIRDESFFEEYGKNILKILKVILRYAGGQTRKSILDTISISEPTLRKIIQKLINLMKTENDRNGQLGGPECVVQIDETMINYKCKSHRGRSPNNRTDALIIAECIPNVNRIWAQIIPNKLASTIILIITAHVLPGSVIHTDEHRSYNQLFNEGFVHSTVCHKYNFINPNNGTHTQNVESLNNCLKYEIKSRKGVLTNKRADFLSEFVWKWNNKNDLLNKIFALIKVSND